MSAELSPEMSLLLAKMTEQLNLQTATITETITIAVLTKVDEKIAPIIEENKKLKSEVEILKSKILNLETNSKRNNILIHGLPEPKEEDTEGLITLVTSTLKDIEVDIGVGEIDRIQRLGKKGEDVEKKIRPILLATTTLQKKIQILKNKKKLKPNTYITHDLPKAVLQKKKENKGKITEKTEIEKRKRSETPSPRNENMTTSKVQKTGNKDIFQKTASQINAFQYMRSRSHSQSDKNTNRSCSELKPNEETGGKNGIKAFVKTKAFKSMNVGFALDEGLSSRDESLFATFVDRRPWQMQFTVYGEGGHGYTMPDGSAMEKAQQFIKTVMAYRDTQKQIMRTKNSSDYTGYTSLNINTIAAGLAPYFNIIPSKVTLGVDMRLSTEANTDEMQSLIDSWIKEAGNKTEISYLRQEKESGATAVDDSNPYWVTLKNTLNNIGIKITPVVCPATSDMLVLRNLGIPALGFSTKANTIARLHAKDEYQNVETFLKGIDIYTEVIKNIGNLKSVNEEACDNK